MAGIAVFFLFFLCVREVPRRAAHAAIGLGVAALVVGVLCAYPTWLVFHGGQHYAGPAQGYNNVYNADLLGPVLPTAGQLVAPSRLATIGTSLVGNNLQENGSYLGIPLICLVAYLVARYWRRLWPLYLALLALTTFVLSLGPRLVVDGQAIVLPVDLPYRKIDRLPGIDNILPVRLSLYVVFFVAVIVALAIDAYHDELAARGAARHGGDTFQRPASPAARRWRRRRSLRDRRAHSALALPDPPLRGRRPLLRDGGRPAERATGRHGARLPLPDLVRRRRDALAGARPHATSGCSAATRSCAARATARPRSSRRPCKPKRGRGDAREQRHPRTRSPPPGPRRDERIDHRHEVIVLRTTASGSPAGR